MAMKQWRCALCHQNNPHRRRDICDDCDAWLDVRDLAWCTKGKHRVAAGAMAAKKSWCRACERGRNARYDRDQAAYKREWRTRTPGAPPTPEQRARWNANRRAAYWRNPEPRRAEARAWYRRNRERKIAYARAWRLCNVALSRANARLSHQRAKLRVWRAREDMERLRRKEANQGAAAHWRAVGHMQIAPGSSPPRPGKR